MTEFFKTAEDRLSWARLNSALCLVCAMALAWAGRPHELVYAFLSASLGAYCGSKIGEAIKRRNK